MQVLHSILQIGSSGTRLTDEYGSENGVSLELMLGTAARLEFDLRGEMTKSDGELPFFSLEGIDDCANYFALDSKNGNSNLPALLKYSGIFFESDGSGRSILVIELPHNHTDGVVELLSGRASVDFRAEVGGVNAEGLTVFAWQFDLTIRSRVYIGNGDESSVNDPEYYTAVQTIAMLNAKGEEIFNELKDHFSSEGGGSGKDGKDGKDGVDGYTPVKGTDYWTDADKAEIKVYVDEAILNGEW